MTYEESRLKRTATLVAILMVCVFIIGMFIGYKIGKEIRNKTSCSENATEIFITNKSNCAEIGKDIICHREQK